MAYEIIVGHFWCPQTHANRKQPFSDRWASQIANFHKKPNILYRQLNLRSLLHQEAAAFQTQIL